jgi:EAL domain-containing protein (putative c-di-GMP-specific phosphodiesterase class I)
VKTIVQIAREHGQRTIAEGVEEGEAAALLRKYGVDYAQGNLFGLPEPVRSVPQS